MDTLVGRQLGKYQIETLLGRGGMAAVYRAQDTALNRTVAIKVLEPWLSVDPRAVERFRREAVTAANLEHPAIVRVFAVRGAVRNAHRRHPVRVGDHGFHPLPPGTRQPCALALHKWASAFGVGTNY